MTSHESGLLRFVDRLIHWLKRKLGAEPAKPPGILEAASDSATLWRVPSAEAGVVACWWICHRDAAADLVISLIGLAQLREDTASGKLYRRSTDPIRTSPNRTFASDLSAYLESQGGLDSRFVSHIFVVAWRSRVPSQPRRGANGSQYRSYLVRPVVAIPADLQGVTNAWSSGDRYAIRITENIARQLLKKSSAQLSWESIINAIDWLDWLSFHAQKAFGSSHVLQPRKR